MSSQLAAKMTDAMSQGVAPSAILMTQLRATQQFIKKRARQHVFPFMNLPFKIRRKILTLLADDSPHNKHVQHLKKPESYREDPVFLPITAWVGNRMLRLETILVTLEREEVGISCGEHMRVFAHWLSGIDLAPAREAKLTTLSTAFDAIKHLKFSDPDMEIYCWRRYAGWGCCCFDASRIWKFLDKCKNRRALTLELDMHMSLIVHRLGDVTPETDLAALVENTCRFPLLGLAGIETLASLHLFLKNEPRCCDDLRPSVVDEAKMRCRMLVAWLEGEYKQRGGEVKVTFSCEPWWP